MKFLKSCVIHKLCAFSFFPITCFCLAIAKVFPLSHRRDFFFSRLNFAIEMARWHRYIHASRYTNGSLRSEKMKMCEKDKRLMIHPTHFHGRDVVHGDKLFYGDARELAADAGLRLLPPGLPFRFLGLKLGLPCATFLQLQREDRHRPRPLHQALLDACLFRLPVLLCRRFLLFLTRDRLAGVWQTARVLFLLGEVGLPLAIAIAVTIVRRFSRMLLLVLLFLRPLTFFLLFWREAEFLVSVSNRPRWCRPLSMKLTC